MKLLQLLSWLNPWRTRRPGGHDTDAADLGTAFGLDASLAPEQDDTPSVLSAYPPSPDDRPRRARRRA